MNRWLRKLFTLRFDEWRLLFEAGVLVVAVRTGLWILPYSRVVGLTNIAVARRDSSSGSNVDSLILAVVRAARCVPGATCLTRAMAGKILFSRYGYEADLRIGVMRKPAGALAAHAWLEYRGVIVIGENLPNLADYHPLPAPSQADPSLLKKPARGAMLQRQ